MREIKFRVWDTANGKYYKLLHTSVVELNHGADDGVVYMQYTGLKDKNSKEIYEGDIIKPIVMYDHNIDYFNGHGEGNVFAIKWVDEYTGFGLSTNPKKDMFILFNMPIHTEHWEVIGNIYENPELLEVEK